LMLMPPYERLKAWQECHKLVLETYRVTKAFPREELYGLTSQARRAAFSAAVNIVEGSAKRGVGEYRRFLDISIGSLAELGYAFTLYRFLFLCSNFTTPSTTVNSVSSDARRTFDPGWNLVPRCFTRMLPAVTNSPVNAFTPRYFGPESRPLREEPTPFL